jgi:hypothetical protein
MFAGSDWQLSPLQHGLVALHEPPTGAHIVAAAQLVVPVASAWQARPLQHAAVVALQAEPAARQVVSPSKSTLT